MVMFFQYDAGGNFKLLALREHPMKGLPIIATHSYWNIGNESLKVTINADGKSTNFNYSTRFGKDNITKIPETGAQSIVFTNSNGDELTVTDAFEKPVPVKVTEPYSIVGMEQDFSADTGSKDIWEIKAPVLQKTGITLSDGQVKAIMSLGK
jgi:hypothetical protein